MCRACERDENGDILEKGRRCTGSDSSEKRRARRYNSKALAGYGVSYNSTLVQEIEEVLESVETTTTPTLEGIKSKVSEMELLKELVANLADPYLPEIRAKYPIHVLLEDGRSIYAEHPSIIKVLPTHELDETQPESFVNSLEEFLGVIEENTRKIGNDINQLVEAESGITVDMIRNAGEDVSILEVELTKAKEKYNNQTELIKELATRKGALTVYSPELRDDPEYKTLYDKWEESREEVTTRQAALNKVMTRGSEEALALVSKQRETLIKVLQDIRPLGGTLVVDSGSVKARVKQLEEAVSIYPTAWIEESNDREPPVVKTASRRAHYSDGIWQDKYEFRPVSRKLHKEVDWQPDPNNKYEILTIKMPDEIKMGEKWLNPNDGKEYERDDYGPIWITTSVEYASFYNGTNREIAPKGRGWTKIILKEKGYNGGEIEIMERTNWYKISKRRVRTESHLKPELTISGKGERAHETALHEYAHRIESTKKIGRYIQNIEEAFIKRRTTNSETGEQEKLQRIYQGKKELARPDNFVDLYMGKQYNDGYREILSTGAESVFGSNYGSLIGLGGKKADLEMKDLIVGLWASA